MLRKARVSSVAPALLLALAASLPAAVVISTGFESPQYPLGNLPNTAGLPVRFLGGTPNVGATIVNSPAPFGGSNQFLNLNANASGSGTGFTVIAESISTLSTYHFDLYEPTGESGSLNFGLASTDLNSTGSYTGWTINNGTIALGSSTTLGSGSSLPSTLSLDRHYKAFVLYNGSAASENVAIPTGGTATLAAGQTALFFYDTTSGTMIDGGRYATSDDVTPTRFMFRSFTASRNQIYIDNFTHENSLNLAVIPEPSAALLLLGAAACGFRRKRA
jgi:hypothetical protein